jgi:hypothetical protein
VLHLTNGDAALPELRAAGLEGELRAWHEILHDGPVPAGLEPDELRSVRASFIAKQAELPEREVLDGMRERDERLDAAVDTGEEVMLWFEADLYDVLLMLQILDRIPDESPARLVLVGQERWTAVPHTDPARLAELGREAPLLDREVRGLARAAWAAFTSPRPEALQPLADGTPALPAVGEALRRLLEEYPWTGSGLGRTERQLLGALPAGPAARHWDPVAGRIV